MQKREIIPFGKVDNSRNQLINYERYQFSAKEIVVISISGMALVIMLGIIFYRSIFGICALCAILPIYFMQRKRELCKERKMELHVQFKEAIMAVAVNLRAGYSIENAFRESYSDCCLLFGSESYICREWYIINKGLDNNIVLETLLSNFAERSGIDDIQDFAEIFQIAKRTGGDLSHIIQQTITIICEKLEVKEEIATLLSAKKMEQRIMNKVPIFIILYVQVTSPGFFQPLYHNVLGIIVMTVCLGIYGAAYLLGKKIVEISI